MAKIVHDINELPQKLKKKLEKRKEDLTPVKFVRDELYSLIKKVEKFGIDKDLDIRRSKSDKMGYNIAQSVVSIEQPLDNKAENLEEIEEVIPSSAESHN